MPSKILLKRGLNSKIASLTLSVGEPAFTTDSGKLYVGNGTSNVLINPVGKPAGVDVNNSYTKFKVNDFGQIVSQANLASADIPTIPSTSVSGLGTCASANTGTTFGQIPKLDGTNKFPVSVIPTIPSTSVSGLGTCASANTGTTFGQIPKLDSTNKFPVSVIPTIPSTNVSGLGTCASANTGTTSGQIPVLDGTNKFPKSVIPPSSAALSFLLGWYMITSTVHISPGTNINFNAKDFNTQDITLSTEGFVQLNSPGVYFITYHVSSSTPTLSTGLYCPTTGILGGQSINTTAAANPSISTDGSYIFSIGVAPQKIAIQNIGTTTIDMDAPYNPSMCVVKIM